MIKKITSFILVLLLCANSTIVFAKYSAKKPLHKQIQVKTISPKLLEGHVDKTVQKTEEPAEVEEQENEWVAPIISDDTAPQIQNAEEKKVSYQDTLIEDEAIKTLKLTGRKTLYERKLVSDEKIVMSEKNRLFKKKIYTGKVKTEKGVKVVLQPIYKVKTGSGHIKIKHNDKTKKYRVAFPEIGQSVEFKVVDDVLKDGEKIIEKDSTVEAQVSEVSLRAMGGAPAEMTLDEFKVIEEDGEKIPLDGKISISGYNLSFWIGVVELATTPLLVGLAAPALRVFPGGQANLTPRKTYVVYYTN